MSTVVVQPISPPAPVTTIAASQSGDQYENNGEMLPFIFNSSGSAIVVTRLAQTQPGERPLVCPDDTVSCGPGLTILPPVSPKWFNDKLHFVQLRYANGQAANLTVAVIRISTAR